MKRLSEVCELVGVTRRALRNYEKIGLLKHPAETEGGYWLYDDESIKKLMLIQIFVEAGYKRRDITKILDNVEDGGEITSEFQKLIQILEDKRKRIDGMIRTIETSLQMADLPYPVQKVVAKIYDKQNQEQSYNSMMNQTIDRMAELSDDSFNEMSQGLPMILYIYAIGACKGQPLSSEGVHHRIQDAVEALKKTLQQVAEAEGEENIFEDLTDEELNQAFNEFVEEMLSDEKCKEEIENNCGEGAAQYILAAIHTYSGESPDGQNIEERKD